MGKSCFKEIKRSMQLRIALGLQMPYRIPLIYAVGKVFVSLHLWLYLCFQQSVNTFVCS